MGTEDPGDSTTERISFRLGNKKGAVSNVIFAFIIMGDEKCWNVEIWNKEYRDQPLVRNAVTQSTPDI